MDIFLGIVVIAVIIWAIHLHGFAFGRKSVKRCLKENGYDECLEKYLESE